jgi:hypothetical protein
MLGIATGFAIPEAGKRATFFEPGCGIGTKLYLARHGYDLDETGWEIEPDYLEICSRLGVHAEWHDLRQETPDYAAYDIVYISRPYKDDEAEREYEESVHAAMRPGAVLIAAFAGVKPYTWACHYRMPWRGVWVKPAVPPDHATLAVGWQEPGTYPVIPARPLPPRSAHLRAAYGVP